MVLDLVGEPWFGIVGSVFRSLVDFEITRRRFLKKRIFLARGLINKALETVDFAIEVVNRLEGRLDIVNLLLLVIVVVVSSRIEG